jgi:hypothetical protein
MQSPELKRCGNKPHPKCAPCFKPAKPSKREKQNPQKPKTQKHTYKQTKPNQIKSNQTTGKKRDKRI